MVKLFIRRISVFALYSIPVILMACICDISQFNYPVDINYENSNNVFVLGDTINVRFKIENPAALIGGRFSNDISDEYFSIRVAILKYDKVILDTMDYTSLPKAFGSFETIIINGEETFPEVTRLPDNDNVNMSSFYLFSDRTDNERNFEIQLVPLVKDTFFIFFKDFYWRNKSSSSCPESNDIFFNNPHIYKDSFVQSLITDHRFDFKIGIDGFMPLYVE